MVDIVHQDVEERKVSSLRSALKLVPAFSPVLVRFLTILTSLEPCREKNIGVESYFRRNVKGELDDAGFGI